MVNNRNDAHGDLEDRMAGGSDALDSAGESLVDKGNSWWGFAADECRRRPNPSEFLIAQSSNDRATSLSA